MPLTTTGAGKGGPGGGGGPATHLLVSAPASATSGVVFGINVFALDASNNVSTAYAGTVHFTSSDGAAVLPANSVLTGGVGSFSAAMNTVGSWTITATDTVNGSITGTSGAIVTSAASSGLIPLSRITTWQPGVTYNGGIPTGRTQSGATISPIGQKATFTGTTTNGSKTLTVSGVIGPLGPDQIVFDAALTRCFGVVLSGAGTTWSFVDNASCTGTSIAMVSYGNDTTPINAALAAAPPNTYVKLANGTFNISGLALAIKNSNITLRGSSQWTGKDITSNAFPSLSQTATTIVWKADSSTNPSFGVLYVGSGIDRVQWTGSINLASDGVKGSFSITLASPFPGSVGELVLLDAVGDSDSNQFFGNRNSVSGYMLNSSLSGNTVTFGAPQNGPTGIDGAMNVTYSGTSMSINSSAPFGYANQLGVTIGSAGFTVFGPGNVYRGAILSGVYPGPFTMSQSNPSVTENATIGGILPSTSDSPVFDSVCSTYYGFIQSGSPPTWTLGQSNPTVSNVTLVIGGGTRRSFTRQDRPLCQTLKVISIAGSTVTFETPLHTDFKTLYAAQLTRMPAAAPTLVNVGVEDLTLYSGQGGDGHGNLPIYNCEKSWVKNVQSHYSNGSGITFYNCYRCQMTQCYMHETVTPYPGGGGYLCGMATATSDSLIEDCEMWAGNKVIAMRGTGGGNVIGYNYLDDAFGGSYPQSPEAGVNAGHFIGPHMELIEGNYTHNYKGDSFWGNSTYITVLRNWISGIRAAANVATNFAYAQLTTSAATAAGSAVLTFNSGDTGQIYASTSILVSMANKHGIIPIGATVTAVTATTITLSANVTGAGVASGDVINFYYSGTLTNYYILQSGFNVLPYADSWGRVMVSIQTAQNNTNFVGNVLGFLGQPLLSYSLPGFPFVQSSFVYENLGPTANPTGTTVNGYNIGEQQDPDTTRWPPNGAATLMRQGNYDYITNSQIWHGIGGAAGSGTPTTIPNSYYLTAAPAFFGANPWPWVDPATGTTNVLPAKARFVARHSLTAIPPGYQLGLPATHFSVSIPTSGGTGIPINFVVTARDLGNNPTTNYSGIVHFTSTDGGATLPADTTLVAGTGTFPVTFVAAGTQTVTATDTVTGTITGTSGSIAVTQTFPPQISGTNATLAADFAAGSYWGAAATQASFAAWLTAIGGTYSRSSSATYLQGGVVKTAAANASRFPTSLAGAAQGLRLTGAATNIQPQSQFASGWTPQAGTLTLNNATGPDGVANSAGTFIANTSLGNHSIFYTAGINYTVNPYTHSIFAKAAGYNFFALDGTNGAVAGNKYAVFDLTTGAVTSQGSSVTAAGSIALANGWWLCWVTLTMPSGNQNNAFNPLPTSTYAIYTGDGVSGVQFFGVQETQTAFLCDYIPTTTVTVTQAADSLSFPYTQTTFSALVDMIGQLTFAGNVGVFGTPGTQIIFLGSATAINTYNSTVILNGPSVASTLGNLNKTMIAGNPSGRSVTSNGLSPLSDANALIASAPTTMQLGSGGGTQSYGNFTYLALWNALVATNLEMQVLTGPSWGLPQVQSTLPALYADFGAGHYWTSTAGELFSFSSWLTALGGTFTRASSATYVDGGVVKTAATNVARVGSNGLRLTGAQTELCLWNRDLTNAVWVKTNMTAVLNQTGADGVINSASALTATAANGTVLQSITNASSSRTVGAYVKRLSGTGTINITQNNGTTWTPITITSSWAFYAAPTATAANPVIGFRIVTSGDSIAVDYVSERSLVFVSDVIPDVIPTTTTSVTQAADALSIPYSQTTFSSLVAMNGQVYSSGSYGGLLGTTSSSTLYIENPGTCISSFTGAALQSGHIVNIAGSNKAMLVGTPSSRKLTINALVPVTDTGPVNPGGVTAMTIGISGGFYSYGNIGVLGFWNGVVASNSEMQVLTT